MSRNPKFPILLGASVLLGAAAHGQTIQAISLNFHESGSDYTMAASDTTGVEALANWNNLAAPTGSTGSVDPWTNLVDSTGAGIAGLSVQVVDIGPENNFTGTHRWKDLPEEPANAREAMMGAGMGYWGSNGGFTISVTDLPSAFIDNEVNVHVYWGGKFSSSAAGDVVTTDFAIGTQLQSLTYGSDENNWMVAHGSEFVLEGNHLLFENISVSGDGAFDLILAQGENDRRIGISGMQIVAVPEPSTYAALVGLLALGLALRRRR